MAEKLSLKSERFCQNWVDTVGNGTLAVLLSYDIEGKEILNQDPPHSKVKQKKLTLEQERDIEEYHKKCKNIKNTAAVMASKMLRRPKITDKIDSILDDRGFEDKAVKRTHFKLLKQSKDEIKMRAVSDYYKLKGNYATEKKEVVFKNFKDVIKELEDE